MIQRQNVKMFALGDFHDKGMREGDGASKVGFNSKVNSVHVLLFPFKHVDMSTAFNRVFIGSKDVSIGVMTKKWSDKTNILFHL